jgi:hypothetical protein
MTSWYKKRLLSRLLIIRSDLKIVNPKDYEGRVKEGVRILKNKTDELIEELIKEIS